jgi:hypothetical protein
MKNILKSGQWIKIVEDDGLVILKRNSVVELIR